MTKPQTDTATAPRALPLAACFPREHNRDLSNDTTLAELAESLRVVGQLHPIHVRPRDGKFEILAGVRRWTALQRNGAKEVVAYVHESCDELLADQIRLIENEHRREATALDTARALRRLKNEHALTTEQIAERTAMSVPQVKRYLSLFGGSDALLAAVESQNLPLKLAVAVYRFEKTKGEVASRKLLQRLAAEPLSAREVDELRKGGGSGRSARKATDPWSGVVSKVEKLLAKPADNAVAQAKALRSRLDAFLREAKAA